DVREPAHGAQPDIFPAAYRCLSHPARPVPPDAARTGRTRPPAPVVPAPAGIPGTRGTPGPPAHRLGPGAPAAMGSGRPGHRLPGSILSGPALAPACQARRLLSAAVSSRSGERRRVGRRLHRVAQRQSRDAPVRRPWPAAAVGRTRRLRPARSGRHASPGRTGAPLRHRRVRLLLLLVQWTFAARSSAPALAWGSVP